MEEMGHVVLDLQRFAEGEPQAAPEGAGAQSGGDVTGAAGAQGLGLTPYQQMVQGQYKQEYEQDVGNRVQQAIQKRFRNQHDNQKILDSQAPIMEIMAQKYGLEANDADGIYKRLTDDLSLYQEEADQKGISPEVVRDMHRLEARNRQLQQQNDRYTEQGRMEEHFRSLSQQAEALKQQFPNFDLMTELQNPAFARMTAPGSGMSVENAFMAIHGMDLMRNGMQYAAQQAGQRIAASVQAGASRPLENGMQRQAPVNMAVDIAHMDKKTREAYRQRIRNGEAINFRDKI